MTGAGRTPLAAALAALGLVVIAEAAWLTILGGLIEAYALRTRALGIAELALLVLGGAAAAHLLPARLGPPRWAAASIALVVAGAILGVMAAAESPSALTEPAGGLGAAIARHPGGLVAGLAVFRGFRHARLPPDEEAVRHLFAGGAAVAVVAALAGTLVAEPWRGQFLADTLAQVVVFAVTVVLGLALARQLGIELDGAERWTPNTPWIGLVAVVVAVTGLSVVPASTIAAPLMELAVYLLLAAFFVVGAIVGWTRNSVAGLVAGVGVALLLGTMLSLSAPSGTGPGAVGGGGSLLPGVGAGEDGSVGMVIPDTVLLGLALGVVALALGALAWWWARERRDRHPDPAVETRFIDRSRGRETRPSARGWLARLGIQPRPVDAPSAYLALIRDLSGKVGVDRDPAETPREHAHRLRTSGTPTLGLELLAADYALARFGGESLTRREDRRGVDRWRELRVRLSARSEEIRATAAAIEREKLDRAQRLREGAGADPDDASTGEGTPAGDVTPRGNTTARRY
jgi:hypothetical protein